MTSLTSTPQRRQLRFHTLDDIVDDARAIVNAPHATLGQWSAGQILDHLAAGIECAFDGYGFRAPLLIRLLVRPFRNGVLVKPMRAGFRLPKRGAILLPKDTVDTQQALARLERCTERLKAENPTQPHPVLGYLSAPDYRLLHLRHSELHLSFIVPTP
ncbi:MAG: DUF1569 domain-containing protein [Planctomycetaceae bacterium]|nr:DUF1569 domain-containing protein [Planctomycetaceae bacterium]